MCEKDIENWPIVKMNEVQTPKQGQYGIGTQFRLVNMLSSRMNGKEFKEAFMWLPISPKNFQRARENQFWSLRESILEPPGLYFGVFGVDL